MSRSPETITSADIYKRMIDGLVDNSSSPNARLVLKEGIYSKSPDSEILNELVESLRPEHRKLLAEMLNEERRNAIHDVLGAFTWWIDCQDVRLTHRGEVMPTQLSGMGLHGDYVGRLDGWEWPETP